MRRAIRVVALAAAACGGSSTPEAGPAAPARPLPGPANMQQPESRPSATWNIRSGAVGVVELGKPIPRQLLEGDLEGCYRARFIADGQPWEGFELAEPSLVVGIGAGPFAADGGGEPDLPALRGPAAAAARGGAPVTSIQVRASGPATEAGIAVGSTLAALRAAYRDLSVNAVPPTLGNDECVAAAASLAGVYFLFRSCRAAEAGEPITRIDLREP